MSGLLGRSHRADQPQLTLPDMNLRIQSSLTGRPRSIGWGRVRVSGNLILVENLQAVATPNISGSAATTGGKGGSPSSALSKGHGSSGLSVTYSWTYRATVILAFGMSPILGFINAWSGSQTVQFEGPGQNGLNLNSLSTTINGRAQVGGTLFAGDYAQAPWSYTGALGPESLAYRGEAYLAFGPMNLGSSPTIPQANFEMQYAISNDLPTVGPDANPADVIVDYLTNTDYGVPQFSSAYLADMSQFRLYCRAFSLLVSFTESDQRPASSMLRELAKVLNVDFVWSSGLLKIEIGRASCRERVSSPV